jgi:ubiquinone/menaquinone biosynthesis C-methylase UbiE
MRGIEHIPWLYDAMFSVADRTGLSRWRDWLTRGATGRVLEVGCGTGRNLTRYSDASRVVGLEPCWGTLLRARRRAPAVPLVQASVEALPFRDGAFDTVVSSLVFCSVPDVAKGLSEIRRTLKPSGQLRMMEHVRSTSRWGARWQDFIQPLWTRAAGGCHPNRDTARAVEDSGFQRLAEGERAQGTLRRFVAVPRRE